MRLLLIFLTLLLATLPAQADELRPGYLSFSQTSAQGWSLIWKAPVRGGITPETQPILPPGCTITGSPLRDRTNFAVTTTATVQCVHAVAGQAIGLAHFDAAQTDVLVRVAPLDRPVQALRLTAAAPAAIIAAKPDGRAVARTYFMIGIDHIVFGFDHLLFVVALVLLLSGFRTIAFAVTAFTLAHSITLVGATLGVFGLPQQPVEAIIALSIAFLAVEIVKKREGHVRLSERIPWVVAFLFGLLHGFGFAGALNEIGLPESDVPTALLTFNLGVEAGQLLIVAATMLAMSALRRVRPDLVHTAVLASAYAIGSISALWLIERITGGDL